MSPEEKAKVFRGKKLFWSAPPDKFKTNEEKEKEKTADRSESIFWERPHKS